MEAEGLPKVYFLSKKEENGDILQEFKVKNQESFVDKNKYLESLVNFHAAGIFDPKKF